MQAPGELTLDLISGAEARTLPGLFLRRCEKTPEVEAYRQYDPVAQTWQSYTWRETKALAGRWRAGLARENFAPGERVAILLRNSVEWVCIDQAAQSVGLAVVPLYVTDNPELFARLKAAEYLNFVGDIYGVDTATRQARVAEYASLFGIKDALGGRIGSFSHGMKQKLLITASLLPDPQNWVLDEPMVGLDPRAAFALKETMRARAAAGKTVFFSTHVMEVAEKLCDRLAIINKGRIVFSGTLAELKTTQGADGSLESLFLELVEDEGEAGA